MAMEKLWAMDGALYSNSSAEEEVLDDWRCAAKTPSLSTSRYVYFVQESRKENDKVHPPPTTKAFPQVTLHVHVVHME